MEQLRVNKIKGFALVALAIFLCLSLFSYHPQDTSLRSFPPHTPVKNLTGIVGAYMAEGLFFSLGWAAYILPLLLFIWAIARLGEKPAPRLYIKLLGTLILLLSSAVLFSLFGPPEEELVFQRSGLAGMVMATFLIKYFGRAGSLLVAAGLGLLSAFVSSEFLICPFFTYLGRGFRPLVLSLPRLGRKLIGLFAFQRRRVKEQVRPAVKRIEKPSLPPREKVKPKEPGQEREKPKARKAQPSPPPGRIKKPAEKKEIFPDYRWPTLDLLASPPPLKERQIKEDLEANARILEETLRDFGVETRVTQISRGPTITRYELEPAAGVKIHRIVELSDDIALAMKAHSVRIVAPIPGKARVGVEVPNTQTSIVYLKEILETEQFQNASSKLTLALGKDISGSPLITDLADMPHLLIAGTTGSGKTVCVNSIVTSLLFNAAPFELKFVMVDPKMVELAVFNNLPHLLCPVLTDPKKVACALAWVVNEMEERYKLLARVGVRNIDLYNEKVASADYTDKEVFSSSPDYPDEPGLKRMPYIVVIIDELADLMVVVSQEVENAITRLAQLSRAVGIHLILATQRPSVDVVTGVIKANFPARISFRVASRVDSRTVLDMNGADKLLGAGDLLFLRPGQPKPVRAQGSLISDAEIERIVHFIQKQQQPVYHPQLLEALEKKTSLVRRLEKDELFEEAVKIILQTRQASVSMLQRRLGLGYTRAARLIDLMEEEGIVGPYRGSKPREILLEKNGLPAESEEADFSPQ